MMMGTAEELPKEPTEKIKFQEDMTEQELASAVNRNINLSFYILTNLFYLLSHDHQ